MERYLIRSAKYLIYLIILMIFILAAMNAVGATKLTLSEILSTDRSLWLAVIVVCFALLYPFFGFTKKSIVFDASKRVEDVDRVMAMCGYARMGDNGTGELTYRASSSIKRLTMMYEDKLVVRTTDGLSVIAGPRKEVVKASFRMTTFIQ